MENHVHAQELDTVRHHCTVLYCTLEDEKLYIEELKFRNCQHYYKSMELHRGRYHKRSRIIAKDATLHYYVLEEGLNIMENVFAFNSYCLWEKGTI